VPEEYRGLFEGQSALLASHRGWDPGAGDLAIRLARVWKAPLVAATVTRLLVDPNRSAHNPRVFSEFVRSLPARERERLLERFHAPHRNEVAARVAEAIAKGDRVLHLSVHSFTPVWEGRERGIDLALLYDPARASEREFSVCWARALATESGRAVRRNAPYRGRSDGLTTTLRGRHGPDDYLGVEIEVSQGHLQADGTFPAWVETSLVRTLGAVWPGTVGR
jgi:predicted N-formylglutamate amidohydrolase